MNKLTVALQELRAQLEPQGLFGRVDARNCLDILSAIESYLPAVVAQADAIVQEKAEILARAEAKAQEILAIAESKAHRMVTESVVLHRAEEEAKRAEMLAKERSAHIRDDNCRIAADTLTQLSQYLDTLAKRTLDYSRRLTPAKRQ